MCIRVCVCVAMETRRDPRMLKTKKTAIETIVAGGSVLKNAHAEDGKEGTGIAGMLISNSQ